MLKLEIGGVDLIHLPPREAITTSGGGRAITERATVEGVIVPTRPALPASRRITITAPTGFVIATADALAIRALGDGPFAVTIAGYGLDGTFAGCTFEEPPRFPETADPRYRGYEMTVYVPQGA